ncbi:hypothetical protein [Nocardioides sp. Root140]|uniref:hypothetical protein n=1 Tax=Nocardioides sp. Root140 TaxID=1736460 RepID=UPI0006F62A56|nr:hypothetical protein [Nocardioides sp. Root140]KQY57204.1 hypothetical protein ASD30_13255 [Nocardioides sp. Root140]
MSDTRRRIGSLAVVGVLALSAALLGGCGGDDAGISDKDLAKALLTADDLGPDFKISPDDDDHDDDGDGPDWGCLLDFKDDATEKDDDGDDIEVEIEASADPGMPAVFHVISNAENAEQARALLSELGSQVDDCDKVDTTEDDTRWQFDVDSDRVAWADGVNQQINVLAEGHATVSGVELPISLSFTAVRVDTAVSLVMFVDMASDIDRARRDVVQVVVDRLTAALDGEDQPADAGVLEDYPIGKEYADLLGGADA